MQKSTYNISKMDCPSEESLIRMNLDDVEGIHQLEFDLEKRSLNVFHSGKNTEITQRLESLKLGANLVKTIKADESDLSIESKTGQAGILWTVLLINLAFFVIEIVAGFISGSMGLVADSLDMLADAVVYGLSLWAVRAAVARKKKVATLSGYLQLALAGIGLLEVIRRWIGVEEFPDFRLMIGVSVLALIANAVCLYLLQQSKSREVHMKASMIFTQNDVIINSGVILAGILVLLTRSKYPDLVVGTIVFLVVVRGAIRILKLGK
ncbi:MAG TPA: cation transporter [Candidatus Aminicenantes bacterium]|nr:cation transporter [Candidatus Aminicenantes bacterium]